MGLQIFGRNKCFDTKKAERFFKERRVKYQYVDLDRYGISRGELTGVITAVGGWEKVVKDPSELQYFSKEAIITKLCDEPALLVTPIVRNGKRAAVGADAEKWKELAE